MAFNDTDLQRNNIVKKLGALLPQIDERVKWADYIPSAAVRTGKALIAIGMCGGNVKYVDISGKSPFKLVNEVLNAMDDYRLDTQFLNRRQFEEVAEDINNLAKDRARVADETLAMLEEAPFSATDCLHIVKKAQKEGIFPDFFPKSGEPVGITKEMLSNFLKTNAATFIDTQILSDLVKERLLLLEKEQDSLIEDFEGEEERE